MINRTKEFESILGKIRKENKELSRNILENVKISTYRRGVIKLSSAINQLRGKLKSASIENDSFIFSCRDTVQHVKLLTTLPITVGNGLDCLYIV